MWEKVNTLILKACLDALGDPHKLTTMNYIEHEVVDNLISLYVHLQASRKLLLNVCQLTSNP